MNVCAICSIWPSLLPGTPNAIVMAPGWAIGCGRCYDDLVISRCRRRLWPGPAASVSAACAWRSAAAGVCAPLMAAWSAARSGASPSSPKSGSVGGAGWRSRYGFDRGGRLGVELLPVAALLGDRAARWNDASRICVRVWLRASTWWLRKESQRQASLGCCVPPLMRIAKNAAKATRRVV